jgi:predicted RNA-binding Zn-ribbon protein involved in translation (DUF1610 family)
MITIEEFEKLVNEGKTYKYIMDLYGISKRRINKLKSNSVVTRKITEYKFNCDKCGKEVSYKSFKKRSASNCSKSCASKRPKPEELRKKISETLKERNKSDVKRFCLHCNVDISHKKKRFRFCSLSCGSKNRHSTEDARKMLSERRIKYLQTKNSNWFETFNKKGDLINVQGTWEKKFSDMCNRLGLLYERKWLMINRTNRYTPDFYFPDFNLYVEVKGYLYEKDKYKMLKCLEKNDIDLRIIFDVSNLEQFTMDDFINIEKVKNLFKLDEIDYSKFIVRF